MLRRSLFASALMLASTVGFAGVASADTATVTFSGSIPGVCTFDNATASGSLATSSSYGNQYLFASQGYAGTEASLNVTCNTAGTVSIGQATPSSSNPVATIANVGFGSYWDTNPISVSAGSTVPVKVSMYAYSQNYGQLPSGNYQYTVTLTAAGN